MAGCSAGPGHEAEPAFIPTARSRPHSAPSTRCELHNQTMTVTTLAER